MNFKNSLFSGDSTTWVMLGLIIVIVVVMIVSSIKKRRQDKIEKEKRQREVRDQIKVFLKENYNISHKRIEYDKVVSRTGKDYKYRDVFDVIVKLYDSKSNELYSTKAFEVEGFSKQINKKEYLTTWKVNKELDLEKTLVNLKNNVKKSYWKMTKIEKQITKLEKKNQKIAEEYAIKQQKIVKKEEKKHNVKKNKNLKKTEILIKKHPNEKFQGKK